MVADSSHQRNNAVLSLIGAPSKIKGVLQSFGINKNEIPVSDGDGKFKRNKSTYAKKVFAMMEHKMQQLGQGTISFDKIAIPTNKDILWGKGGQVQDSPGNQWFREQLNDTLSKFQSAPGKQEYCLLRMRMLLREGARFLVKDDFNWWNEVKEDKVRIGKILKAYEYLANSPREHSARQTSMASASEDNSKRQRVDPIR